MKMNNTEKLKDLVDRFSQSLPYFKDAANSYNEHSCRIEFIDPLLKLLGWDVANEKGLAPQYREVIAENYSNRTDCPDYTMTLRGVAKFFVEAKNRRLIFPKRVTQHTRQGNMVGMLITGSQF